MIRVLKEYNIGRKFTQLRSCSVTLGPGILDNIFDGIERPLRGLEKSEGAFLEAKGAFEKT